MSLEQAEQKTNTLCNKADTDNDGFSDYAETQAGTDPQDPASHP